MTQSKHVGIKFLLRHGHYFAHVVADQQARQLVQSWLDGKLAPMIAGESQGYPWCIRTEDIIAIHTFDLNQVQQQQSAQKPFQGFFPGASGVN